MAVATIFTPEMTKLTANTGGGLQQLLESYLLHGRIRKAQASLTFAAQASGSTIHLLRIPLPCIIDAIIIMTDTSLATAQFSLGDTNSAALYSAAQTFTTTNTPTMIGKVSALGVPITTGYDAVTGLQVTPYAPGPSGGGGYEDIVMVTSVAALPASGSFRIICHYCID